MNKRILCIGGSTRDNSSSEVALRSVAARCTALGARVDIFAGKELALPIYHSPLPPELTAVESPLQALLSSIVSSDGIIICSPGYHGLLSGMIKNVLDYVEELRDDCRPYFEGRPVGCMSVAYGWQAASTTLQSLRTAVHALRGWPTPLGVAINATSTIFDSAGECSDESIENQLDILARQVLLLNSGSGCR